MCACLCTPDGLEETLPGRVHCHDARRDHFGDARWNRTWLVGVGVGQRRPRAQHEYLERGGLNCTTQSVALTECATKNCGTNFEIIVTCTLFTSLPALACWREDQVHFP